MSKENNKDYTLIKNCCQLKRPIDMLDDKMREKIRAENIQRKAKRIGVPVIGPRKEIPIESNPTIAICGQCGLELKQVMHYCCMQPNCPCFNKVRM